MSSSISEQSTIRKRYIVDNGLLNLFLFSGETKLLENIVACKLIRKYRNTPEETQVYYYNKNVEIDFVFRLPKWQYKYLTVWETMRPIDEKQVRWKSS